LDGIGISQFAQDRFAREWDFSFSRDRGIVPNPVKSREKNPAGRIPSTALHITDNIVKHVVYKATGPCLPGTVYFLYGFWHGVRNTIHIHYMSFRMAIVNIVKYSQCLRWEAPLARNIHTARIVLWTCAPQSWLASVARNGKQHVAPETDKVS